MAQKTFGWEGNILKLGCTDGCTVNTFSKKMCTIELYTSKGEFYGI